MPLYEYHCDNCQLDFEEQVSFAQADKIRCPSCDSAAIKRLASIFASANAGGEGAAPACFNGG